MKNQGNVIFCHLKIVPLYAIADRLMGLGLCKQSMQAPVLCRTSMNMP